MTTDDSHKTRVLMELRTCFERFAGIPQETRLLFSAFLDADTVDVHGLINHTSRRLARGLLTDVRAGHEDPPDVKIDRLSRFIISTQQPKFPNGFARFRNTVRRELAPTGLAIGSHTGMQLPLYEFDARNYSEFIWESLFAITLPPEEIGKISTARYRTMVASWQSLHHAGLIGGRRFGRYPLLAAQGYDIFFSQTPFPARTPPNCRLVVRYHDAIPMYLPHTIHTARFHQKSHYRALRDNAQHAVFACTSAAARSDILKMFPSMESRTPVIHDVVSEGYFPETAPPQAVAEIIRSRTNPDTEPKWLSSREKIRFYGQQFHEQPPRYLLMVSTIEPRKNHLRLIRAWERLRSEVEPDLKLVIVGTLGWGVDPIVEAMRPWQERGAVFNLSSVPARDLRVLYGSAACVVCPSVAEGFDLSGVEAMLCGGAVAASDIPVHREVYGECAHYFDRYSIGSMAETIGNLIRPDNAAARQTLCERGPVFAQRYRRDAIAPQWSEVFSQIRAGGFPVETP